MASDIDGKYVCPGDRIAALPESGKVRVGANITPEDGYLVTSKAGRLRQTKAGKLWVDGRQKRYSPAVGDPVIGLILDRFADGWRVDISGPFPAMLPSLAFEGVTRRTRPNLQPGDLVYGRLTAAPRDTEPEMACMDANGKAAGFGPLQGGYLEHCSTYLARNLLASPTAPILLELAAGLEYEVAIGLNGRLWIRAAEPAATILVANAALASEFLTAPQCKIVAQRMLAAGKKQQ